MDMGPGFGQFRAGQGHADGKVVAAFDSGGQQTAEDLRSSRFPGALGHSADREVRYWAAVEVVPGLPQLVGLLKREAEQLGSPCRRPEM
ncbi:hypothetical protein [Streptomyces sp. NPDC051909]|uniref:hypothetical protein n=1 Tax=Streptomyces sp. NPDC051909 TaxID=3154944 RepID=UPI003429F34A